MTPWLKKLRARHIWRRLLVERLSEPIHLNLLSAVAAAVGSIETKIEFDLVIRNQHAFALLNAARKAKASGLDRTTAVEFGVASGAGLMNICEIAARLTPRLNVAFDVIGFDTGTGMPPPQDYRDHPEHYGKGDFPMEDGTALRRHLPQNAKLILGPLSQTVPEFREQLQESSPLGFVSLDVDYFSSSLDALKLFDGEPEKYLPVIDMYVDDLMFETHNSWSGELGAIREFNDTHDLRKIEQHRMLRDTRIFKNAAWISHMYSVHVLDHVARSPHEATRAEQRLLANPYLR